MDRSGMETATLQVFPPLLLMEGTELWAITESEI